MNKITRLACSFSCYFWQNPLVVALLLSASLLAGAYGFQYIGGMTPCDLCWPQRYAHMVIIILSAGGLLLKGRAKWLPGFFTALVALAFAASAAVSGYHAGVEQKWWKGPTTCTSDGLAQGDDMNMENIFDNLMTAKLVLCDEIPWSLLGISMAGYNFLISSATLLFLVATLFLSRPVLSTGKNHD